jgi:Flp pilus assembly pilin Flp
VEGMKMKKLVRQFVSNTEGQDLIEYALLAATIAIGVILGMQSLRNSINSEFTLVGASVNP